MGSTLHHSIRRNLHVAARIPGIEALESRRLLTVVLDVNNGVLNVTEDQSGVNNSMRVELENGASQIEVIDGGDSMSVTPAATNAGWALVPGTDYATGPDNSVGSIVIDTDDGNDDLQIPNINLPVLIQPRGSASITVNLGQNGSTSGAQDITGAITFDGTEAKSAELNVDDGKDPNNLDPTITSRDLLDFAGAPIHFIAPPVGNSSGDPLSIACSTGTGTSAFVLNQDPNNSAQIGYQFDSFGTATVGIEHLNANSHVSFDPQTGGTERVILGSLGLISGVQGKVIIEGNAGSASLVVDDHNDPTPHTFAATNDNAMELTEDGTTIAELSAPATAFTLETGTASNTVNLDLTSFTSGFTGTVVSNGTNDAINVMELKPGEQLNIVGGAGVDPVSIAAASVPAAVNISNPTGKEAVSIDGSSTTAAQIISVSDSSVTGDGTGTFTLADLASLSVTGGTAFDNFSLTPSATVPITVDGGPSGGGASTDRLAITTTNASGTGLSLQTSAAGESGTYTFANAQPVTFTRFGTISPTIGDVTGTVYDEQTAADVSGATLIVDENNNGVADAGEPTATTDANGAFSLSGLPTGTFPLLLQESGFALLAPITVTVSAGALATPLLAPIVPVAIDGAPDLTATLSVNARGKTGSIKPKVQVKVIDSGAAMASAVALKIVLAASTDTTLDPADTILLTADTAPVLLKANKSKTFTLTGITGPSLAKGNYHILASIDAANAVAESNEANNVAVSAATVPLAPAAVDLTGKFAKLPKAAANSKPFAVNFMLQNLGTIAATGTVDFDLYASKDQTLDGSDISIGASLPISAHVAAGKSQTAKFKLSLSALPAGAYYLVAKVNSTSSIAESDTSNDTVFSATQIVVS